MKYLKEYNYFENENNVKLKVYRNNLYKNMNNIILKKNFS